jgi:hypothetical protein
MFNLSQQGIGNDQYFNESNNSLIFRSSTCQEPWSFQLPEQPLQRSLRCWEQQQ